MHCCKPFESEFKCSKIKRKMSPHQIKRIETHNLHRSTNYICNSCAIKLNTLSECPNEINLPSTSRGLNSPQQSDNEAESTSSSSVNVNSEEIVIDSDLETIHNTEIIEKINTIFPLLDSSPYAPKKAKYSHAYAVKKSDIITKGITRILVNENPETTVFAEIDIKLRYSELMSNIKENYKISTKTEQVHLLSLLPQSMSELDIKQEFNASSYMIKLAKKSQETMSNPLKRIRSIEKMGIDENTKQKVIEFFEDDEISRLLPGKNDSIVIRIDGEKKTMQKRLMLTTVQESYVEFKNRNQQLKIGKSKFAALRPKHCIKLGDASHNVCLCTIHENVKLMFRDAKISTLSEELKEYKDCINYVLCNESQPDCYMLKCADCPKLQNLTEYLESLFEGINEIRYNQWTTTDRCDLINVVDSTNDFIEMFIKKLKKLIPHHFISKQQSQFIKNTKENLKEGEFLVMLDYAENYSCIIQDSVQAYHWSNTQATIHPFTIYYKDFASNTVKEFSFVAISEYLIHNSAAVHLFISKMIEHLRIKHNNINKIYYVSDGAASQYKNKFNILNVRKHEEDFNTNCEWHFHATSHGKGPCDGLGGTLKRGAARASLAGSYIRNAFELYEWAKNWNSSIDFCYTTTKEHEAMENRLKERFNTAKLIKGTQSFHAFIPNSESNIEIITKQYSNSLVFYVHNIVK